MSSEDDESTSEEDDDIRIEQNNIVPKRAVELRRRIENRKQAWKFLKGPFYKPPLQVHPMLPDILQESRNLTSTILDQTSAFRAVEVRSSVQFKLSTQVETLGKDVAHSTKTIRASQGALSEMESSISQMQNNLFQEKEADRVHTQVRLDKEILHLRDEYIREEVCKSCGISISCRLVERHESTCRGLSLDFFRNMDDKKTKAWINVKDNGYVSCPLCWFLIKKERITEHTTSCVLRQEKAAALVTQKEESSAEWTISVPPKPPCHVHIDVEASTASSLVLVWDPPVFTGACEIIDYEISYSLATVQYTGEERFYTYEACTSIWTSRWVAKEPVAVRTFQITNLQAASGYGNIYVKTKTKHGLSEASTIVEYAETTRT